MPRIACILLAGGSGSRFSYADDKLMVNLKGQSVITHSACALFNHAWVSQRVLVCPPDRQAQYLPLLGHPTEWAPAGETRQASVRSGLQLLEKDIDWVLVHDAARPLAKPQQVDAFVAQFNGQGGSAFAHPAIDTIRQQQPDGDWLTLPRSTLWVTETPQIFVTLALVQAHQSVKESVTDDLQLLELAGLGPVQLWHHRLPNHKITHRHDVPLLEQFID